MASDPGDPFREETDRDFDDIARITRTFVHYGKAFLIALPLWLVLLALLPRWGVGELTSLLGASLIAGGVAVAGARMTRRPDGTAPAVLGRRRRISPPGRLTIVGLTAVIVLYLVLVLRAGG
jgi:hypothetical protein